MRIRIRNQLNKIGKYFYEAGAEAASGLAGSRVKMTQLRNTVGDIKQTWVINTVTDLSVTMMSPLVLTTATLLG